MWRILFFLLVSFLPMKAMSQWVETAPSLLGPISQSVGAMTYSSGVAWAGALSLWSSTDQGVTWTENSLSLNGAIAHIFFKNRSDGLVTTHTGGVYRTSDGGMTWKNILTIPSATSACFLDSSSNILVSEFITPGNVHFSRDGGTTWTTVPIDTWIREIIPVSGGKAYLLAGDWSPGEHIWETTNYGASWTELPALLDADCWSFALDPCDPTIMYLANEGYSQTVAYDGLSRLLNVIGCWNYMDCHVESSQRLLCRFPSHQRPQCFCSNRARSKRWVSSFDRSWPELGKHRRAFVLSGHSINFGDR